MRKIDELMPLFHIKLSSKLNRDEKLLILTTVYNKIEEYIMHFDTLRLRNFNFALVIFASLLSIGVYLNTRYQRLVISIAIVIFMIIFLFIERKYHKFSHGFQRPSYKIIQTMTIIDNESDIEFDKYDNEYAKKAELFNLQTIIYLILIIGGVVSYFIFPLIKMPK